MKVISCITVLFLLIIGNNAFAENLLSPPSGQPVQCTQVYESAAQPKVWESVLSSMTQVCYYNGGLQATHKIIGSYVILTCIGDNPDSKIFSCLFSASGQEL